MKDFGAKMFLELIYSLNFSLSGVNNLKKRVFLSPKPTSHMQECTIVHIRIALSCAPVYKRLTWAHVTRKWADMTEYCSDRACKHILCVSLYHHRKQIPEKSI